MVYALLFGLMLPVVVKMNEVLGRSIGSIPASTSVHLTGAIFLGLCVLPFFGREWVAGVGRAPWWAFLGGVFGSLLVVLANRAIGSVGVAGFTAVSVATQLVISAGMDHWGLMGATVNPMTLPRAGGMALLAAGVVLVVRG